MFHTCVREVPGSNPSPSLVKFLFKTQNVHKLVIIWLTMIIFISNKLFECKTKILTAWKLANVLLPPLFSLMWAPYHCRWRVLMLTMTLTLWQFWLVHLCLFSVCGSVILVPWSWPLNFLSDVFSHRQRRTAKEVGDSKMCKIQGRLMLNTCYIQT